MEWIKLKDKKPELGLEVLIMLGSGVVHRSKYVYGCLSTQCYDTESNITNTVFFGGPREFFAPHISTHVDFRSIEHDIKYWTPFSFKVRSNNEVV